MADYKGSVTLISGLKQANGGDFPLVDGSAVQYKQEEKNGKFKSLVDKIEELEAVAGNEIISEDEIQNIMSTVFAETATLLPGKDFRDGLKGVLASPAQLIFTKTAIPTDEIDTATVVSTEDSQNKIYAYSNDTTLYVSPEKDNVIMYCNEDSSLMFNGSVYTNITAMDLSILNTSKVTNMDNMFFNTKLNIQSLDLSGWDTSNVTDMSSMFRSCKVTTLDISGWDTSNVTSMSSMFNSCTSLTTITGLENLDVSKITSMNSMFSNCTSLTTLDLSGWDTSNVTDMSSMFRSCKVTTLDISGWDTSNVTSMSSMFSNCTSLTTLDLSGWDTSNVTSMSGMFSNCTSLTTLDLSHFDTSKLEGAYSNIMFDYCTSLTTIKGLENLDVSKITSMNSMFSNCTSLTTLDLSGWDTSNVTDMNEMFNYCTSLTTIKGLENFNTSKVTKMIRTFNNCNKITSNIIIRSNRVSSAYYKDIFTECSTKSGSSFVVNYIESAQGTAEGMVSTKSKNSNVTLGVLIE